MQRTAAAAIGVHIEIEVQIEHPAKSIRHRPARCQERCAVYFFKGRVQCDVEWDKRNVPGSRKNLSRCFRIVANIGFSDRREIARCQGSASHNREALHKLRQLRFQSQRLRDVGEWADRYDMELPCMLAREAYEKIRCCFIRGLTSGGGQLHIPNSVSSVNMRHTAAEESAQWIMRTDSYWDIFATGQAK